MQMLTAMHMMMTTNVTTAPKKIHLLSFEIIGPLNLGISVLAISSASLSCVFAKYTESDVVMESSNGNGFLDSFGISSLISSMISSMISSSRSSSSPSTTSSSVNSSTTSSTNS